jgi:hypothetical protein
MTPVSNIVVIDQVGQSRIARVCSGLPIPLTVVEDPDKADLATSEMDKPLIFIELNESSLGNVDLLNSLINSINLPLFPVVLLGAQQVDEETKEDLRRIYKDLKLVDFDYSKSDNGDVHALVKKSFNELYEDQNYSGEDIFSQRGDSIEPDVASDSGLSDMVVNAPPFGSRLAPLLDCITWGSSLRRHLNGDVYTQVREPRLLLDKDYLPRRVSYQKIVDKIEAEATRWEIGHVHRTAFVSYNILQSLNLEEEMLELARATAVSYLFPTAINNELVTRVPYIRNGQTEFKKIIRESIRANSMSFQEQSELRDIAPVVMTIADIIDQDSLLTDSISEHIHQIATAIVIADVVDRECWQGNYWDSSPGYAVIRWIENSMDKNFNPAVVWECARFLAEAFEATPVEQVVTKQQRREYNKHKGSSAGDRSGDSTLRVDKNVHKISQLLPGMRLAEPLKTFDGRHILDSSVCLDRDIIWRLWRLSALYPIEPVEIMS